MQVPTFWNINLYFDSFPAPLPGLFIPEIIKNVNTLTELEHTMEALAIFLFMANRPQEDLEEARRELGWVYDLAQGFLLHRLPHMNCDAGGVPPSSEEVDDYFLEDENGMQAVD